ncbi:MAG TPA: methyltransferase domain-containing protein [Polyangiaceae bacterium]|nr:methyltransferase domain-containing protein [Polyangiaceae bacterium]
MDAFSINGAFARGRAALRTRLTLRGPRAYADTHAVALSLLEEGEERGPSCAPRRALDLGAGRGELSTSLAARGYAVTAVERYGPQFEAKVPLVDADLNEPFPFADASFDTSMAIEILEHLENPRRFLREIGRTLRPGGVAIVSTPNLTSLLSRFLFAACGQWDLFFNHPWRLRDPYSSLVHGHITPVTRWLLEHHARDAGFVVEARRYSSPYWPGVPWQVNPLPSGAMFGRILLLRLRKCSR